MKYAMLIYPQADGDAGLGEEEATAVTAEYLLPTRAELLRRLGRADEARAAFAHALRLATTDAERRLLARRLAGL